MAKACYSWTPSIARAQPGGAACSPRLISIRVRVRVRAIRARVTEDFLACSPRLISIRVKVRVRVRAIRARVT